VDEGLIILGGGARVDYGDGPGSLLTEMYPVDRRTWHAKAKDHMEPSEAMLSAYCVAARLGDDDYVVAENSDAGDHRALAYAYLPRGYHLVGGGARTYFSELPYAGSLLTGSIPGGGDYWVAAAKDHQVASPVVVTAYAIGLHWQALERYKLKVLGPNQDTDSNFKAYPKLCLDSQHAIDQSQPTGGKGQVTCGGAALIYNGAGSLMTGSWPEISTSGAAAAFNKWCGSGKDHNYPDPAQITVYSLALVEAGD
jgi:hypothetical protein